MGGWRFESCRARDKHWHLVLDRLTSSLTVGSVCVSRGVLRFSREIGRLYPSRLTVIPNGVDTGLFDGVQAISRATLGIPENAHLVLSVGRLDHQKGLPDLLDAAEQVIAQRSNWHLAMAGDRPC